MQLIANKRFLRGLCFILSNLLWMFLLNVYLKYWQGWSSLSDFAKGSETSHHLIQFAAIATLVLAGVLWARLDRTLNDDADLYSRIGAYIVRATFWSVLFIGIVDSIISMLRVEGALSSIVGEELSKELGRPAYRGKNVHFPLILLGTITAYFTRGFVTAWLALLVVLAEFQIVISRFVFSYEQAYMGDLVRFWYAGLFLFTSAYTLVNEGHVRVDVLYAHFSERKKAWSNLIGSLVLGLPLCWVILTQGMSGKGAVLVSPLLSFEISQSGFGLFVKYLMSLYLVVFAVTMALQFASVVLRCCAIINDRPLEDDPQYDPEPGTSAEFHSDTLTEL